MFQLWHHLANFNQAVPDGITKPCPTVYSHHLRIPPTVTDYRGHRQTLFPVREINLKAYTDVFLTEITWPALGIEPRAMHRQLFKPAAYRAKPRGQGFAQSLIINHCPYCLTTFSDYFYTVFLFALQNCLVTKNLLIFSLYVNCAQHSHYTMTTSVPPLSMAIHHNRC